jgi:hypothetical protein
MLAVLSERGATISAIGNQSRGGPALRQLASPTLSSKPNGPPAPRSDTLAREKGSAGGESWGLVDHDRLVRDGDQQVDEQDDRAGGVQQE